MNFKKVVFTSDIFRVYEESGEVFSTPFKNNVRWIKALVGDPLADALKLSEREFFFGDEKGCNSLRWKTFSSLDLPFSMNSWCQIYDEVEFPDSIKNNLYENLKDSLIFSYEASPALLKAYTRMGLQYIDISIHPLRFLDDYIFAIRTNINEVRKKILHYKLQKEICNAKAHIYKAKAAKLNVFQQMPECSVLFAGQMGQDSSLIENGRMLDLNDVKFFIEKAASNYPKVYYKKHPHNKNTKSIEEFISKIKRVEVVDWNIYDALGSGVFSKIVSLSSGVLHEARAFGFETVRYSMARDYYDESIDDEFSYIPVMRLPMIEGFWKSVFHNEEYVDGYIYDPYRGGMQKSLNVSWGGRV